MSRLNQVASSVALKRYDLILWFFIRVVHKNFRVSENTWLLRKSNFYCRFLENINTFMNLATTQVKNSVDLQSANNGIILKNSVISSLGLSLELHKG